MVAMSLTQAWPCVVTADDQPCHTLGTYGKPTLSHERLSEGDIRVHNLSFLSDRHANILKRSHTPKRLVRLRRTSNRVRQVQGMPCSREKLDALYSLRMNGIGNIDHSSSPLLARLRNWIQVAGKMLKPFSRLSSEKKMETKLRTVPFLMQDLVVSSPPDEPTDHSDMSDIDVETPFFDCSQSDSDRLRRNSLGDFSSDNSNNNTLTDLQGISENAVIFITSDEGLLKKCEVKESKETLHNEHHHRSLCNSSGNHQEIVLPTWRLVDDYVNVYKRNTASRVFYNSQLSPDEPYERIHRKYELLEKRQVRYDYEKLLHEKYTKQQEESSRIQRKLSEIYMNTGKVPHPEYLAKALS